MVASGFRWFHRLLDNSRFWVLAVGVGLSANIAGFLQLEIPSGSLQVIRIEQTYGFLSLLLLYLALLATPLTQVFPRLPLKDFYRHARRAIGVLAGYYAFLHSYISFFQQLAGFTGIAHLNSSYAAALAFGAVALAILGVMAATSFDWAVDTMGLNNWKRLHRLVYLAGVAVLLHVAIIGPHYTGLNVISGLTAGGVAILLALEAVRIYQANHWRSQSKPPQAGR